MRRAALVVALVVLAACGSTAPTAYSVVQSYLTALGEGNYPNACAVLDQSARASLHAPCAATFTRCLANEAGAIAHDQTQQLYANINLTGSGNRTVAEVSGTAVARTVRKVTLADEHGNWRLTSPGQAFRRCRR